MIKNSSPICQKCSKIMNERSEIYFCPFNYDSQYCSKLCFLNDWEKKHFFECQAIIKLNEIYKNYGLFQKELSLNSKNSENKLSNFSTPNINNNLIKLKEEDLINPGKSKKKIVLGRGSFSKVLLKENRITHELYAVKIIKYNSMKSSKDIQIVKCEIKLQESLFHPHIISIRSSFESEEGIQLILEYGEEGDLAKMISQKGKIDEERAIFLFIQTCSAVEYLHKNKIIHRDLKPSNLMMTKSSVIKLIDFGLSAKMINDSKYIDIGNHSVDL